VDGAGIRFYATLRPVGYGPANAQGVRKAVSGQSHVMLIFLKPGAVESLSVTPFGISDRPDSPHYEDQTQRLFAENRLKPTFFAEEALRNNLSLTKELLYRP
jgi:acyl-homoserine-lactone acylase